MLLAGMVGGAVWAGIAAGLRLTVKVNEAISTLLLNFVALDLMLGLIYDPWKDASGFGQPSSRPLADAARPPLFAAGSKLNIGLLIAVIAVVVVWWALKRTEWGFRLRVVGAELQRRQRSATPAF